MAPDRKIMAQNLGKILKQLGYVRINLPGTNAPQPHDPRLMELFRNRAELKKSFNQAQDELQQWRDRLRQQAGLTARAEEALKSLEQRLSNPESGYPVLVYYQLRELWNVGLQLLRQHAADLGGHHERVEREIFESTLLRQRTLRLNGLDRVCDTLEETVAESAAEVARLRAEIQSNRGWWLYFRRRKLNKQHQGALQHQFAVEAELADARGTRAEAASEVAPEFPGLSLSARRVINESLLCYAGILRSRVEKCGVWPRLWAVSQQDEPEWSDYGSRAACEESMVKITHARLALTQRSTLENELKQMQAELRTALSYEDEMTSVPNATALANGNMSAGAQALANDDWGISELLT
jgi:hypothetical protein